MRARQHIGVGHARHWHVGERFTAAVTGRRNTHKACVELVLHVPAQHAIFDQDVVLPRYAFIVDGQRAAAVRQRAIIDDRA